MLTSAVAAERTLFLAATLGLKLGEKGGMASLLLRLRIMMKSLMMIKIMMMVMMMMMMHITCFEGFTSPPLISTLGAGGFNFKSFDKRECHFPPIHRELEDEHM